MQRTAEAAPIGVMAPRASIAAALEREAVAWLGTVRPDGAPHVAPVWFVWEGSSLLLFSKPHAQKVRNIRAEPRVTVAIGTPGVDFDVELIQARAELPPEPAARLVPLAFGRKYAGLAARAGLTLDLFAATYSQPIRVVPTRWLGWGGQGWQCLPGGRPRGADATA